jgi:hypothetical protein
MARQAKRKRGPSPANEKAAGCDAKREKASAGEQGRGAAAEDGGAEENAIYHEIPQRLHVLTFTEVAGSSGGRSRAGTGTLVSELGAGRSWRLEAGGWRLEAGGWRLEAGGWRLEAEKAEKAEKAGVLEARAVSGCRAL